MVAYSFKPQFVAPILAGRKAQTIRAPRRGNSHHARPGDRLQLYRGMRTSSCELILRTICTEHHLVTLRWRPIVEVLIGREKLPTSRLDDFAQGDGFDDFEAMERFWAETHRVDCFAGELMRWKPPLGLVEMGAEIT